MPCTTILVGKKASFDGSTMIARNDDGQYETKKLVLINPSEQKKKYKGVIEKVEVELNDIPCKYTLTPNVTTSKRGLWGANGINEYNVGMTATETITSNPLVLGADPLVKYKKASKGSKETFGGIGEEDLVYLVLPYIKTAKEGVIRLGKLLEKYGTSESNGIAFNDKDSCWWMETIGGHHWIARRVKDEEVVIMPNQFGLDNFDFKKAKESDDLYLCSSDLEEFVIKNHLISSNPFNPRLAFGSHSDADHVYNTSRAWWIGRYLAPSLLDWDKEGLTESDNLPWSVIPERLVTVEDVKYILSSHYQGTKYDPYSKVQTETSTLYRPIAVNRTDVMAILQIRPYVSKPLQAIEWLCFGPNMFNVCCPVYTNASTIPSYLSKTTEDVSTDSFYWASILVSCLADHSYGYTLQLIERYQNKVFNRSYELINKYDNLITKSKDYSLLDKANEEFAQMVKEENLSALKNVLLQSRMHMKSAYQRSDN